MLRLFENKRFPGYWCFAPVLLLTAVLGVIFPAMPAAAGSGYTLPPVTQLTAAAYGNGAYVVAGTSYTGAGAVGSFVALTATDGENWTVSQPLPGMNIWNISQIAFGNGIFVAVGSMPGKENSGVVLTSSDGMHWSANTFDILYQVAYANGRFLLLGYNSNYVSTDGVNWKPISKQDAVGGTGASQLIFGNGVFAYFDGSQFNTSVDGVNWQTRDTGVIDWSQYLNIFPNIGVTGAVYDNGRYLVVGEYYPSMASAQAASSYPVVITSQDGAKWTMTKADCQLAGVTAGNGVFVAISPQGGTLAFANLPRGGIAISSDGATWMRRDTGAQASYDTVLFCNDRFVALDSDGTISSSPDGVNWTSQQPTSPVSPLTIPKSTVIVARFLIKQDFWYQGPGENAAKGLMDTVPYIDRSSGRVLVPVRYLAEALGERSDWDAATQTVSVIGDSEIDGSNTTVTMVIGSATLDVNGRKQTMDQAPVIRDGRTYLPARYVAEAFGYNVSWNATSQTVTLSLEE